MAEYSKIAKGHFTSSGSAQVVNLPFQPDRIEMINYTLANTAATSQNVIRAYWDISMGQGQAVIEGYNATPTLIFDVVATNGISTFAAGQLLQYGPLYSYATGAETFDITKHSTAPVVTTSVAHGLASGNVVIFENLYQTSTTGMTQICGIPFTVTVTGATTFTINWNTNQSTYTAFNSSTSTGNVGSWKQVLYPYLYAPEQAVISAINTTTGVVTTTAAHNFQIGQEIAFRIPSIWGSTQLNSLPNVPTPGSPIYYYVIAQTQNTFTVSPFPVGVTAYNSNFNGGSVLPTGAFSFAQAVPVGDVNTGGVQIYSGSPLYPSPLLFNGNGTTQVPTINGPAIIGSFVNNTSQGFIIGAGAGRVLTTASLVGASTNVIYWAAYYSDLAVN